MVVGHRGDKQPNESNLNCR